MGEAGTGLVTDLLRELGNADVDFFVWVGNRTARAAEVLRALLERSAHLLAQLPVGELRQMRVAARVRPDLPAAVAELSELIPGHTPKLMLVRRAMPGLNSLPPDGLVLGHERGRGEHRRGQAEPGKDRLGYVEHRGEAVVEGDGEGLGPARLEDRFGERRPAPAGADEHGELALERVGCHRDRRIQVGLTAW